MATSEILNALANILDLEARKGEATKDRALRMAELKFRADEEHLGRLERARDERFQNLINLSAEFSKVTGVERNLDRLKEESGLKSEASSIIGASKKTLADNISALQGEVESYDEEALNVVNDMASYGRGLKDWEPFLEKYRTLISKKDLIEQGTVGPREWEVALEENPELLKDPVYLAGLKTAVSAGGELRVRQLLEQAKINAMLAGSSGRASVEDVDRQFVNKYNSLRDLAIGRGMKSGIDEKKLATIPNLGATSDASTGQVIMKNLTSEAAKVLELGKDLDFLVIQGDTPEHIKKLFSKWKSAVQKKRDASREGMALISAIAHSNEDLGDILDFKTMGGQNIAKLQYAGSLIDMIQLLSDWEWSTGMSPGPMGTLGSLYYDEIMGKQEEPSPEPVDFPGYPPLLQEAKIPDFKTPLKPGVRTAIPNWDAIMHDINLFIKTRRR